MASVIVAATWWASVKGPLAEAGVNTVIGLCIVFVALIFISFIISLFKYIGKLEKTNTTSGDVQTMASQSTANELNIDNFELVAIATAAISEYEEAQGNFFNDGIVVRSIKKIS